MINNREYMINNRGPFPIVFMLYLMCSFAPLAHADYLVNQDTEIIGKKLWVYYDIDSCRDNFKIYPSKSNSNPLAYSTPIEVRITDLNKTPLNWYAGAWYDLTINDGASTTGHLIYDDMNANHGYTKNLYYSDTENIDLVLLKNACISNISPQEKSLMISKASNEQIARDKTIQAQDDKLKLERDQAASEAKRLQEQSKANEIDRLNKEEKASTLKNAPEDIKKLSEDEFCDYYGDFLRGGLILGFGTSEEMKSVMINETKRRKVKVSAANVALIKNKKIKLGITACELYASWGEADDKNRSVGSFGVYIQHVYGNSGTYVYTENGRVTSWQD